MATDNSSANLTIQRLASSSDVSKAIAKTDDTELSTGVSESNNSASYNNSSSTNTVLLSTAIVYVVDSNGVKHQCRALLDSASQINFKVPDNIKLADPEFNKSNNIDMLLGASIFYELLTPKQYHLGKYKPVLQGTI
ncbi:hypothetical protein QE152_g30217 [Popillia japonica]|uniref:Uncharacterized protein n=1 Tax=Popillia japonica TaxID=7064 RepID=A0AAW1JEZ0_POPJA